MNTLQSYIQNINESLILEAFKSSKLRELVSIMKDFANDYRETSRYKDNTESALKLLPKGVAWDKITDSEVFIGESGDSSFMKKYVNDKYICIWYPIGNQDKSKSYNNNIFVDIRTCYLTCGDVFINLPGSIMPRKSSGSEKISYDETYHQDDIDEIIRIISKKSLKPNSTYTMCDTRKASSFSYMVRPSGDTNRTFTVDDLAQGKIIAYCMAISKETIVKYSTLSLIISRAKARFGGIYMGDDEWERTYRYNQKSKRQEKLKEIRDRNLPSDGEIKVMLQSTIDRIKGITRKITMDAISNLLQKYEGMDTCDFSDVFLGGNSITIAYKLSDDTKYISTKRTLGEHIGLLDSALKKIDSNVKFDKSQVLSNINTANKYIDSIA